MLRMLDTEFCQSANSLAHPRVSCGVRGSKRSHRVWRFRRGHCESHNRLPGIGGVRRSPNAMHELVTLVERHPCGALIDELAQRVAGNRIDRLNLETRLISAMLLMRPSQLGYEFNRRSAPLERDRTLLPLSEVCGMRKANAAQRGIVHLRGFTGGVSKNWWLNRDSLRSSSCLHMRLLSTCCAPRRNCGDSGHAQKLIRITFRKKI